MNVRLIPVALTAAALSTVWACGTSNPTRPSTTFTAPISNGPANGTNFNFNQQPITLTIVNAVHTGPAPTYNVDVASNADFSNVVFSQQGIPEGAGGTTTVTVSSLAGNTTYYWRWRAVLDGVEGEPSGTQSFFVKPNIVLNAPVLVDPDRGLERVADLRRGLEPLALPLALGVGAGVLDHEAGRLGEHLDELLVT